MPLTVTPHSTSIQLVARFIRHVARNCSTAVKVSAARIPTEDRCINSFDVASTSIARSTTIVKRIPVPLQFSDSVFRYNPCRTNWNRRTESSSGSQLTRLTGLSISTPLLPSPIIPRLIVRWQGSIESRRRSAISLGTAATMSPRPAFNRDWAVLRALKDDCSCPLCSPLLEESRRRERPSNRRLSKLEASSSRRREARVVQFNQAGEGREESWKYFEMNRAFCFPWIREQVWFIYVELKMSFRIINLF